MAGLISKRQREEPQVEEMKEIEDQDLIKRQKSYNQIVSLLEEEEEEPIEDLSSIITTLQQEISSSPNHQTVITVTDSDNSNCCSKDNIDQDDQEDGERERVMRHLLEASDDELGIPNGEFLVGGGVHDVAFCDALWELEDEAANYYTLFHSQLFM